MYVVLNRWMTTKLIARFLKQLKCVRKLKSPERFRCERFASRRFQDTPLKLRTQTIRTSVIPRYSCQWYTVTKQSRF